MEMDKIYEIDDIRKIIAPILKKYGVHRAYLFGSYARGEAHSRSDIDLRIDGDNIPSMLLLGGLYEDLKEALQKPIDLITTAALYEPVNQRHVQALAARIKEDEKIIYDDQNI